jgi:hypothetical protein
MKSAIAKWFRANKYLSIPPVFLILWSFFVMYYWLDKIKTMISFEQAKRIIDQLHSFAYQLRRLLHPVVQLRLPVVCRSCFLASFSRYTFTSSKKMTMYPERLYAICIALMLAIILFACRKRSNTGQQQPAPAGEQGFFPEQNKRYHFDITDDDGSSSTLVTTIVGANDSAGLKVLLVRSITTFDDGVSDTNYHRSFIKDRHTIHMMGVPKDIMKHMQQQKENPAVFEWRLQGERLQWKVSNEPKTGNALVFSDAPIVSVYRKAAAGDSIYYNYTIGYTDGKMLGEEVVVTNAGTFLCSKWAYVSEGHFVFQSKKRPDVDQDLKDYYKDTIWLHKGIGPVKSVKIFSDGRVSHQLVTILKKIA